MEIIVNIPDPVIRLQITLRLAQELAAERTDRGPVAPSALRDAIDAAVLEAGRNVANHALVSIEEAR